MQYQTDKNNILGVTAFFFHKVDTDELSIKVIKEHMNQKIEPEDIDRSHRLGNPKKSVKLDLDPLQ